MSVPGIIVAFILWSASAQSGPCDDLSGFKQLMAGPPGSRYEYRGRYVNLAYEYSVRIPNGLTAYDGRDEARHNGFLLASGKGLEGVIFVSGDPNSMEFGSPREAAIKDLEFLRQQGKKIESETIIESHLGTLKAVRLVVIYTCQGSSDRHIKSSIMALGPDKSPIYELTLYTPAPKYERDRLVLEQIASSWKRVSHASRRRPK